MQYIFLLASIAAAIHAYSFARWLGRNGNKSVNICFVFSYPFIGSAHL